MNEKGFQLIEALLALVLLSLAAIFLMGAVGSALRVTGRGEETTKAILAFEKTFYELETNERPDLIYFGGKEARNDFQFEIKTEKSVQETSLRGFYHLDISMKGKGRDSQWNFLAQLPDGGL